jgi:hypothetical protein
MSPRDLEQGSANEARLLKTQSSTTRGRARRTIKRTTRRTTRRTTGSEFSSDRQSNWLTVLQPISCGFTLTSAFGTFILGHITEGEPDWQNIFVGYGRSPCSPLQILTGLQFLHYLGRPCVYFSLIVLPVPYFDTAVCLSFFQPWYLC